MTSRKLLDPLCVQYCYDPWTSPNSNAIAKPFFTKEDLYPMLSHNCALTKYVVWKLFLLSTSCMWHFPRDPHYGADIPTCSGQSVSLLPPVQGQLIPRVFTGQPFSDEFQLPHRQPNVWNPPPSVTCEPWALQHTVGFKLLIWDGERTTQFLPNQDIHTIITLHPTSVNHTLMFVFI